jgi:DNA repair protein RadC
MQNRSQSPPPHRSSSHIYSCIFNAIDELGGVVHNHPSGDPQPSTDDIHVTHQIIAVGKPLKVAVHDHLIIGKQGHVSLKGLRMI